VSGCLVEKFKKVTPHKELCECIKTAAGKRNLLAHKAAEEYLKFPVSLSGANVCQSKADYFQLAGIKEDTDPFKRL